MSVSSDDFCMAARKLLDEQDEIFHRASISRAYYAAFHEASDAADNMGLPEEGGKDSGMHERLISRFSKNGKGLAKIASRLRARKLVRAQADYSLSENISLLDAKLHCHQCEQLIEDIKRIKNTRPA